MKAVVFDMDGLMFDTERIYSLAWDYAGEKAGIGKAGYLNSQTLGMNGEMVNKLMDEVFGKAYDSAIFKKYTEEFFDQYFAEFGVPKKKGLLELLEYLKANGYKVAVASSTDSARVKSNLKGAGVADYFQVVIGGEMVEKSKPEPDIYLTACQKLGVEPEESYALEDSRAGLWSAHRAGCKAIVVPDLWDPDEETLQIVEANLQDLSEVMKYIDKNA